MPPAGVFFAHSTLDPSRGDWQPLREHLEAVAVLAAGNAAKFGAADWGRLCGLLHDLGKYAPAFQERFAGGARVDHATAGAVEAQRRYGPVSRAIQFVVAGHHAGLADGWGGSWERRRTPLAERLNQADGSAHEAFAGEVVLPSILPRPADWLAHRGRLGFRYALLARMLFSCLVDADYRDTEAFYARVERRAAEREAWPSLAELGRRLDARLAALAAGAADTPVNALRAGVLGACRGASLLPPGAFSLTVPTGGGKTLSSLAFALGHALKHKLDRVIYVIPFTSIVEQTAGVFRDALGEDAVLEHHSAFEERPGAKPEARGKLKLAMETWDAPVVVTTAVQFFESLFGDRPSRCRKLHSIARSVVVLDEAQTVPLPLLRPCVAALDELARSFGASVVLCTATQPGVAEEVGGRGFEGGLRGVREITPEPEGLYRALKRVRVSDLGTLDDAALAGRLRDHERALCVVDARAHARELYEAVGVGEGVFHLSALMCPKHRSARLREIRRRLDPKRPERCVVVSTSLVEAGVDVDFPAVYRALAGIDSLAQAAGRCNREGRLALGEVFVFRPAGRTLVAERQRRAGAAEGIMRRHEDPLSLEAVREFFAELYWAEGDGLDRKGLMAMHEGSGDPLLPFERIAREFRMIEEGMMPVVVPHDREAERLAADLHVAPRVGAIARKLQRYVVQIPPKALAALLAAGSVAEVVPPGSEQLFHVLTNKGLYRDDVGLTWDDPTWREAGAMIV